VEYQPIGFCKLQFKHDPFFAYKDTSFYAIWLNEYTNKLIRHYIPKKEAFTDYTDEQIVNIQHKLNRKPRKLLNFDNPKYCFFKYI
jgi:IS30 family transposase